MTRDEVIDVLSVVAAATRRTVGDTDVEVWSAVMGHCDKQLAMRAVRDHLRNRPGVWLEPGHIVAGVRGYLHEQRQRETDEQRAIRERGIDAKSLESAIGKPIPPDTVKPAGYGTSPLAVKCPWCGAAVAAPCHDPNDHKAVLTKTRAHPSRVEAAEKQRADVVARQRAAAPPVQMEDR